MVQLVDDPVAYDSKQGVGAGGAAVDVKNPLSHFGALAEVCKYQSGYDTVPQIIHMKR
jgi:hypothetical protein